MFLNNRETKASNQCLESFHHDLLLNFSEESLFEGTDRTFNDVYVELPYPIVDPKGSLKPPEDIVVSLIQKKKEYLELLESKRRRYKFDSQDIFKKKLGNNEFIYLPQHLVDFYQRKDPDKYFHSDYNYYFTGGSLGVVEVDGTSFLIYPDGDNQIFLQNVQNSQEIVNTEYKTDSPIHSIYTANKANENVFLAREKFAVTLLCLDENNKAVVKKRNEYKSPVLDSKWNENNLSHRGILLTNGNLTVSDTETGGPVFHYKTSKEAIAKEKYDNFQQFRFFDNNLLCLMDNYKVNIIDYRTKSLENTFDPEVINCNTLCNFVIKDNALLLASRHYIMKTDLRNLKTVSSYSHTLDVAPCYMDIATNETDVYLAVAGQRQNSKVLFTGSAPYSLPYKVPSIATTLESTMLMDPTLILHLKDFSKRLDYSITGLKVLKTDGKICIFTSNCLGEIFRQCVSEHTLDNNESLNTLSRWLKMVNIPDPALHLTLVEEMSDARFSLNTEPNKDNLKQYKSESKANAFLAKFEQRYQKKNVKSTWAKEFLSVWEDLDENDEDDIIDNLPEVPVADKVEGWIQDHEFVNDLNLSYSSL